MRRRSAGSGCSLVLKEDASDLVELASGVPTVVGRRSFRSRVVRGDARISRRQLELVFDEATGTVRAVAVPAAANPSFREEGETGEWRRVAEESLEDGDCVALVGGGPVAVVRVEGRRVVYGKKARQQRECVYGLQCAQRQDEQHCSKYAHSEPQS